jgi:hypothetical protein
MSSHPHVTVDVDGRSIAPEPPPAASGGAPAGPHRRRRPRARNDESSGEARAAFHGAGWGVVNALAASRLPDLPHDVSRLPHMAALFGGLLLTCLGMGVAQVRGGSAFVRCGWAGSAAIGATGLWCSMPDASLVALDGVLVALCANAAVHCATGVSPARLVLDGLVRVGRRREA